MEKYLIVLCLCFYVVVSYMPGRGKQYLVVRYDSDVGTPPWGISHFDFISGSAVITMILLAWSSGIPMRISAMRKEFIVLYQWVFIADATNDTMQNGSGINPGAYSNLVPDGHLLPQSALILKKPEVRMNISCLQHYG
ncbi:MAG: hypothetical protein IPP34_22050 [Bacteroidetes bacterium]|nr:hypothetical protein [Bacteroidota bacterium]